MFALFFNPLIIAKFYTADSHIDSNIVNNLIILIELIFTIIGLFILIHPELIQRKIVEIILLIFVIIFCYFGLVIIDYFFLDNNSAGIIYSPGLNQNWSGIDFNYKVSINSLGLRDKEVNLSEQHIFVLGDSMVFGVGSDYENTIPRRLTIHNNRSFLNLGKTGGDPYDYTVVYEKIHRLAKPDYTIVILYLGNDLDFGKYGLNEEMIVNGISSKKFSDSLLLKKTILIFKNIAKSISSDSSLARCEAALPKNPSDLDPFMYENYLKINKTLYEMASQDTFCEAMDINPFLVSGALKNPNFYHDYFTNEQYLQNIEMFLRAFDKKVKNNDEKVLFVLLPPDVFVSEKSRSFYSQLNMNLTDISSYSKVLDDMISFCSDNNLDCVNLLPVLKESNLAMYWEHDVHLTPAANDLIAKEISKKIIN